MKKDPAKIPIPATAKVIWGQFRMRVLPLAIFSGLVATTIFLWDAVNYSSAIPGVAEGVRSMVASPQPGLITELKVKAYQLVNEGDPIAVIQVVDSRMPLELAQAEIQLARLRSEPSLAQQNAMDYQRVRVDLLRFQTELAVAKVNLQFATKEANRNLSLYKDKQIAEYLYDLSVQTRDALEMEVAEKSKVVTELEQRLADLRGIGDPQVPATNSDLDQLLARIEATQACAATNWGTVTLVAPVSGMVSPALRQAGEFVQEGEPLVTIQSPWSDRVV
ncbi:MAG TPA: biotin/lipoyl-binding protein, partial [Clostridia bacterium]|nr:biotin/lipoyl-binding protein [Clostridia bacterium]